MTVIKGSLDLNVTNTSEQLSNQSTVLLITQRIEQDFGSLNGIFKASIASNLFHRVCWTNSENIGQRPEEDIYKFSTKRQTLKN